MGIYNKSIGSLAVVYCDEGFVIKNHNEQNSSHVCLESGIWSPAIPTCIGAYVSHLLQLPVYSLISRAVNYLCVKLIVYSL